MDNAILIKLVEEVKDDLSITWDLDEAEARRLERTVERSVAWLESRAKTAIDWSDTANQSLAVLRCRLDWNHATEFFEENFHPDLVAFLLRNRPLEDPDEEA